MKILPRLTLVGSLTAVMLGVPVASGVAAPCSNLYGRGSTTDNAGLARVSVAVQVKGSRCGNTDVLSSIVGGYTVLAIDDDTSNYCSGIRKITLNVTPILNVNPGAKTLPCNDVGARVTIASGTLARVSAGTGDRSATGVWTVDTIRSRDNHDETSKATLRKAS